MKPSSKRVRQSVFLLNRYFVFIFKNLNRDVYCALMAVHALNLTLKGGGGHGYNYLFVIILLPYNNQFIV